MTEGNPFRPTRVVPDESKCLQEAGRAIAQAINDGAMSINAWVAQTIAVTERSSAREIEVRAYTVLAAACVRRHLLRQAVPRLMTAEQAELDQLAEWYAAAGATQDTPAVVTKDSWRIVAQKLVDRNIDGPIARLAKELRVKGGTLTRHEVETISAVYRV